MKTCFKCGDTKPLDDFYRHPQMADGHLNKCKECNREDSRQEYWRNSQNARWAAKQRARGRDKWRRLYRGTTSELPSAAKARTKRYRAEHPHRFRAHSALGNAVRDGRITKPKTCQRCGAEPLPRDLHGHHHDYSKPLDVEWVCTTCHGVEHWVA